ncbi:hypothetical protein [Microbacterium hominis]|uniref:Copper resistance protein CopC n=1 Tax=Microbacterium hominis TaxID=162426 RepID=A0A7D4UIA2_9MICO|nr:hypothetical protein [Microbacterium hominis]QKJ18227.1 hypothetical protein HQM25_01630 [Microbacterium hominis]
MTRSRDPLLPRPTAPRLLAAAAAGLLALASLLVAAPASAHDEIGTLVIVSTEPAESSAGEGAIDLLVEIELTFVNDGHPATTSATVTAIAEGADGSTVGPVIAAPSGTAGIWTANLTLPTAGEWTVRLSSLTPKATLEQVVQAAPLEPTPTEEPAATPTPAPTATAAPPIDDASGTPASATDDAIGWVLGSVVGALAITAVVLAVLLPRRSARQN